jgi:mannose-6-phosphate isomerase-like protein (cupin superfamily)
MVNKEADVTVSRELTPTLVPDGDGEALWFLGNLVTTKVTGDQTVVEFVNPPGFGPPLHRHRVEDEVFYVLSGVARFFCADQVLDASPGDVVLLPRGLAHTFLVGGDEPLRTLQITTPAGFEDFARMAGVPAGSRTLPAPGPVDPAALAHAADLHGVDILGPPPQA